MSSQNQRHFFGGFGEVPEFHGEPKGQHHKLKSSDHCLKGQELVEVGMD